MYLIPMTSCSRNKTAGCKKEMATEVKQPDSKPVSDKRTEKEERELALLVELAKIYYDGP